MRLARRYFITGRVQGVGYRYFAQSAASSEAVNGWARNLSDGRVEILAEGEPDALDRFERHLRRGPAGSRVDDVEQADVGSVSYPGDGFRIR